MHIKDLYSIVVTEKHAECRDFYVRWFGFQVVFEASWFVYLQAILRTPTNGIPGASPYALFYRIYGDTIVIVACMHAKRDPRRWQRR